MIDEIDKLVYEDNWDDIMAKVVANIEEQISNRLTGEHCCTSLLIHPTSCNQLEEWLYKGDPCDWTQEVYFTFPNYLDIPLKVYKTTQCKQGEILIL